jgi:FG-GAP-like repeat
MTSMRRSFARLTGLEVSAVGAFPHPLLAFLFCVVAASAVQAQAPPFRFVKDLIPGDALPVLGLADFDLDGDQDLLTNGSGVYLNDGNGWFTPHPVFSNVRASVFDYVPIPKPVVAIGDLNADGFPDVLAWQGFPGYPVVRWTNQGSGGLASVPTGLPGLNGAVVRSIALGDVDGDGDLDAVLALSTITGPWATAPAPIQLWLNDGAGNFTNAPAQAPAPALMPSQLVLRDFDADGDADLFVGGSTPTNLAQYGLPASPTLIFVNAGAGNFSVATSVPVSPLLDVFAIGDVNGDGLPDVAADASPAMLDCSATSVPQVLINQGNLSFIAAPSTVAGLSRAVPHLVDVDGNGAADLLRAGYDGVSVHLGSAGSLAPPSFTAPMYGAPHSGIDNASANSSMLESATGDVDGDGDIDLVVFTRQGNHVLFNDSAAQPVFMPDFLAGRFGSSSWAGDVEGDGDVDLVLGAFACNAGAHVMRIASNDGFGNLTEGPPLPCPACPVVYETAWVFFDADQDGDLDADAFSFPFGSTPTHQILLNSGGTWVAGQTVPIPLTNLVTAVLRAADLDADGDLDLVAAMNGSINAAQPGHVLLKNGTGSFQLGSALPPHATRDLEIADLDGDGDLDLLGAGAPASTALVNNGLGGFTPSTTFPTMGASSVEAADLDGDGDVDVVLDNAVFLNTGTGSFAAAGVLQIQGWSPSAQTRFALLDVDDDSDVDFLTWWGHLRRNQGNGTFSPPEMLPFPLPYPAPILHADFDRDGDQDLVARGPSILTNMTRQLTRLLPARPGRLASLELGGLPGGPWFLFVSPGTGTLAMPPFGTVFLDLPTTQLFASGTFSSTGTATVTGVAPTGPGVIGLTLYWQAAMAGPQGLRFLRP